MNQARQTGQARQGDDLVGGSSLGCMLIILLVHVMALLDLSLL